MTKTGLNIDLLRDMVLWVEKQEQIDPTDEAREWYQGWWYHWTSAKMNACDTAFCVAGRIAYDHGFVVPYENGLRIDQEKAHEAFGCAENAGAYSDNCCHWSWPEVSNRILGVEAVDTYQLHPIYDSNNTAAQIRRYAEAIANDYGEVL